MTNNIMMTPINQNYDADQADHPPKQKRQYIRGNGIEDRREKKRQYIKNLYNNNEDYREAQKTRVREYYTAHYNTDEEFKTTRRANVRLYYEKKRNDPEFMEKRRQLYAERLKDPALKEKHREAVRKYNQRKAQEKKQSKNQPIDDAVVF
jgi:hypothetical protein